MAFDFKALHDGLMRNNIGLGGVRIQATVTVRGGQVRIEPTGQVFPLQGSSTTNKGFFHGVLRVLDVPDPAGTPIEIEGRILESPE